jgi:hypothetical protein
VGPGPLTGRFAWLEWQIAQEKGEFTLFARFMREDVPDRWDPIVSARWVGDDKRGAVSRFGSQIKSRRGEEDVTRLARIAPIDIILEAASGSGGDGAAQPWRSSGTSRPMLPSV